MASSTTTFTTLSTLNHHERRPKSTICRNMLVRLFVSMLVLSSLVAIVYNQSQKPKGDQHFITTTTHSVSGMVRRLMNVVVGVENSTTWQQPAYHFRPHKNFLSDPDAPLYYKGWYHLFYQYNPDSVVWGNVTWAHAVSKDLVNWLLLPLAMVPDHWYDINGVMSGSYTILPDGRLMMFYSGMANNFSQLQCLAFPKNSSDPLLIDWVKYDANPVLYPPPGIGPKDFRDPSNLWIGPDGKYRMIMGSKHNNTIGVVLVFHTTDFIHYKLLDDVLHSVPGTGMWECADIYPVSTKCTNGLDMSVYGSGVKYVLKQSGDEDRHDWYAIGSYDAVNDKWYPDDPELDLGIGLRYDYGKFYASKTFYDPLKKRRILWGYVGETDTVKEDRVKNWANILNFPRTVTLDIKTQTNLIQWPIDEVEKLRFRDIHEFKDVELRPGSVVPLDIGSATKLDISASFKLCKAPLNAYLEADVSYNCTTSEGSAGRGSLGPFGLLVLTHASFAEQTPVYFYIAKNTDGTSRTYFCADESRSSTLSDVGKRVYGSTVPVLHGEDYNMRLLVDHSIVESFAQGGRTVISSRVYPTKAIYKAAKLFLFNNSTGITVKASLKIWKMGKAKFKPFRR